MLLIVGEAIVAYQRDLGTDDDTGQPYTGPWASGSPAIAAYVAAHITYHGEAEREFAFAVSGSAATQVRVADLGTLPERAAWVHLSGSALVFGDPLAGTALAAFDRARRAGARTSVDPNVRPEVLGDDARTALAEAIGHADVLLPSGGEMEALGLEAARLVDAGATVCTTYGPAGAEVRERGGTTRLAAVATNVVDTDGAGDAFAAGFIAASLRGASAVDAAGAGLRVAAMAIAVDGPMTAELDPRALDGAPPVRR